MLKLYDCLISGNAYKVRLLLHQLGIPFERVELDLMQGETRTPGFLAKNPNGRVPVLELEDGTCLAESNAILWYLSEWTRFLPEDRLARAQVLQWMFFEQYSHEPHIAVARFWKAYSGAPERFERQRERLHAGGYAALDAMEGHQEGRTFLVGDRYSIADISLYAYTHVAHEGDFDLGGYPAIRGWLARVASRPGHVTIDA